MTPFLVIRNHECDARGGMMKDASATSSLTKEPKDRLGHVKEALAVCYDSENYESCHRDGFEHTVGIEKDIVIQPGVMSTSSNLGNPDLAVRQSSAFRDYVRKLDSIKFHPNNFLFAQVDGEDRPCPKIETEEAMRMMRILPRLVYPNGSGTRISAYEYKME